MITSMTYSSMACMFPEFPYLNVVQAVTAQHYQTTPHRHLWLNLWFLTLQQ